MIPLLRLAPGPLEILCSRPVNLLAFNLMWFGLVVGRERLLWLVVPLVLAYCTLLVVTGTVKLHKLALPAALGITVDTTLTLTGVFEFAGASFVVPLWLLVLWFAFATTLTLSLQPVGRKQLVAVTAGAVGVPFNYAIGEGLGAVSFGYEFVPTLFLLSLIWAILLPCLFYLAKGTFTGDKA